MYKLYYFPGNANLTPHMVLEEMGVPYELALVDRNQNAHKKPDYLKLNPTGRIPTLIDGDLVLYETAAITLYLAEKHPAAKLIPPVNTPARAHFYKWLMYLTNTVQAENIIYFYPERWSEHADHWPAIKARAEEHLGGMFDLIDAELAAQGPYLLGTDISALDFYIFMLGRWGRMHKHPPRARVNYGAFLGRMLARPAVQRTLLQEGLAEPYY